MTLTKSRTTFRKERYYPLLRFHITDSIIHVKREGISDLKKNSQVLFYSQSLLEKPAQADESTCCLFCIYTQRVFVTVSRRERIMRRDQIFYQYPYAQILDHDTKKLTSKNRPLVNSSIQKIAAEYFGQTVVRL